MLRIFVLCMSANLLLCHDYEIHEEDIGSSNHDIIAAFCDYNADKHIDTLVISNLGKHVDVLLSGDSVSPARRINIIKLNASNTEYISATVPNDFNGDGTIDILVHKIDSSNKSIMLSVYWGHANSGELLDKFYLFDGLFTDEAIVFDYDSDMLPDILMESTNGELFIWKYQPYNSTFIPKKFNLSTKLSRPHSAAFVNIAEGTNTDLILQTEGNIFFVFSDGNYTKPFLTYNYPSFKSQLSISSFADFNQDGSIEHIIADISGEQDYFKIYYKDAWHTVLTLDADTKLTISRDLSISTEIKYSIPLTLHTGDFNQDGFTDILAIVDYKGHIQQPILFENVECHEAGCIIFGRKFVIRPLALPLLSDPIYLATFFDLNENGNLDIIMTAGVKNVSSSVMIPYTVILTNILTDDTCFIKVTVASGLCNDFCSNGKRPHGVNSQGPTITYHTFDAKGNVQKSSATQMSQTAHFALQLPYVIFGLGRTPNFVDSVSIYIPEPHDNKVKRMHEWTQIIPNSQLLVNPYTPDDPLIWKLYLFVMPSKQIYITAAVLGSTCVGLAILTGGLLWLEKKEDRDEKKQDSQKFHFDAM